MRKFSLLVVVLVVSLSGCYWMREVETSEVGLRMQDGVTIDSVVSSGRYSSKLLQFYANMENIDVSAKTLEWSDPDLVTKDKQPIGLQVGVTYARMRDTESITNMWNLYRGEAQNDELLKQQVLNRIPRIAKAVTAEYTLDQMLGVSEEEGFGREVVTQALFELLETELKEVYIQLLDVGINNISPSEEFLKLLEAKANAQVAVEVARSETAKLQEQLKQEQAQTNIELEKARRNNLVNEELAKVYEQNPQYYELERLRLFKDVVGPNDKFWFIPEGSDITLFLGDTPTVIPQEP